MLEPSDVPAVNPAVRGPMLGALYCARDAIVEPRRALPALRAAMTERGGYTFVGGRTAVDAEPGRVRDHTGAEWRADLVILCPGAAHTGVAAPWLTDAPVRRCRLQMMQTGPLGKRLTTSVADGDSLRYYPAFAVPEAAGLPDQAPIGAAWRAQLLIAQRADGELTIGDTHVYDEPYDFAVESEPYEHLRARAESILGRALPPVERRWAGVYSQATDASVCVRVTPDPSLVVVTGPGGRGMTLSPAIAADTFEGVEW
jgi:FAD dependent oxidoreductase TIGR03364